jgi:hypothetical protein
MNEVGHVPFLFLGMVLYLIPVGLAVWAFYLMYLLTRALRKYLRS